MTTARRTDRGKPAIAIAVVLTVLAVAFLPGLENLVEQVFQQYVGAAAC